MLFQLGEKSYFATIELYTEQIYIVVLVNILISALLTIKGLTIYLQKKEMKFLKKLKSLFCNKKHDDAQHVYLFSMEMMTQLANAEWESVKEEMGKDEQAFGNHTSELVCRAFFYRGFHCCYKNILESVFSQLSIDEQMIKFKH